MPFLHVEVKITAILVIKRKKLLIKYRYFYRTGTYSLSNTKSTDDFGTKTTRIFGAGKIFQAYINS
jgi:hypothetical protein